jgi:hypothetical protein
MEVNTNNKTELLNISRSKTTAQLQLKKQTTLNLQISNPMTEDMERL